MSRPPLLPRCIHCLSTQIYHRKRQGNFRCNRCGREFDRLAPDVMITLPPMKATAFRKMQRSAIRRHAPEESPAGPSAPDGHEETADAETEDGALPASGVARCTCGKENDEGTIHFYNGQPCREREPLDPSPSSSEIPSPDSTDPERIGPPSDFTVDIPSFPPPVPSLPPSSKPYE